MKSNGHWNSKNPKDLAVFGLVPALAIFGPCQPLEVWIRRLFIERHLLLPYVFDKMASRFQIFQSETLLGTGRETFVVVVSQKPSRRSREGQQSVPSSSCAFQTSLIKNPLSADALASYYANGDNRVMIDSHRPPASGC